MIKFPNVRVWTRDLFIHYDKYSVMPKMNGYRRKIITDEYVFDCEEINNQFIILDAYKVFGKVIDEQPFETRLKLANKYINRRLTDNSFETSDWGSPDNPKYKVIEILHPSIKELFELLNKTDSNDDVDGLILRNKYDSFLKSRVYKLKTPKMSTVDFLVKDNQLFVLGKKEEVKFNFILIDFNKEFHPEGYTEEEIESINKLKHMNLNEKIVEMTWDGFSWQPLRIRTDKFKPNKERFALDNAENVFYPMSIENIFNKDPTECFIDKRANVVTDIESKGLVKINIDDIPKNCIIEGTKGFKLMMWKRMNH